MCSVNVYVNCRLPSYAATFSDLRTRSIIILQAAVIRDGNDRAILDRQKRHLAPPKMTVLSNQELHVVFSLFFKDRMCCLSFDISKKSAIFKNKFEILLLSVTNTHGVYFVKSHQIFFTFFLFYPS